MPKVIEEIRQFVRGTVSHPSETDIDIDASSKALNIDPNSRDGLLAGINEDLLGTELLSNFSTNLVDFHAIPDWLLGNDNLFLSNIFCIDASSKGGYKSAQVHGPTGKYCFIVSKTKIPWLTASNSNLGTAKLYNNYVGISSHLDHIPQERSSGYLEANWLKGVHKAEYPAELTEGDLTGSQKNISSGNVLELADDDGWLTGSIIPFGFTNTIQQDGNNDGIPVGTYYAMPIILSSRNSSSTDGGKFAVNCYGTTSTSGLMPGIPSGCWGVTGSTVDKRLTISGADLDFGIYQPYVRYNDFNGVIAVDSIADIGGNYSQIFVDSLNNKIHYLINSNATAFEPIHGLGASYPTTSKLLTLDLPASSNTITSASVTANSKELHIGTGNTEDNPTLWTGYTVLPQFGVDNTDPILETARLSSTGTLPAMHKIVEDDQFVYGIAWYGKGTDDGGTPSTNRGTPTNNTKVWKFKKLDGAYGSINVPLEDTNKGYLVLDSISTSSFNRLTAICLAYPQTVTNEKHQKSKYYDGTDSCLWVHDSDQGARGTMFLLNRSSMAVISYHPIMAEFNFNDNAKDYFTDMHEVWINGEISVQGEVPETVLYGSVPCLSQTFLGANTVARYHVETYIALQAGQQNITDVATTIPCANLAGVTGPAVALVGGQEYVGFTSVQAIGGGTYSGSGVGQLAGCTRNLKTLPDGQVLADTYSMLSSSYLVQGTKVEMGNWNEFPDYRYHFSFVPRTDLTNTDIQSGTDRNLFKKDGVTNWYNKQEIRPLSIPLVSPGNGHSWVEVTNTFNENMEGLYGTPRIYGIQMIENCKGHQPAAQVKDKANKGGFKEGKMDGSARGSVYCRLDDYFTTPTAMIAGNNKDDNNSQGWKPTGQWATYKTTTDADAIITKTYTGGNANYDANDLECEIMTNGDYGVKSVRSDFDARILFQNSSSGNPGWDCGSGTGNAHTIEIRDYVNSADGLAHTMVSNDGTDTATAGQWPAQTGDRGRDPKIDQTRYDQLHSNRKTNAYIKFNKPANANEHVTTTYPVPAAAGAYAMAAWIRIESGDAAQQRIICAGRENANQGAGSQFYVEDKLLKFLWSESNVEHIAAGVTELDDGKWHHVVATVNRKYTPITTEYWQTRLYVDGEYDGGLQLTTATQGWPLSGNLTIGKCNASSYVDVNSEFVGDISEFAYWAYAGDVGWDSGMRPYTVKLLAKLGRMGQNFRHNLADNIGDNAPDFDYDQRDYGWLEVWLAFDDCIGTTILDKTGHGNHGTIVGTPSWEDTWHYIGIKKSTGHNNTSVHSSYSPWDPNLSEDNDYGGNSWNGFRYRFKNQIDFSAGALSSIEFHINVRHQPSQDFWYKPSFIKVTVPRLPFGSVEGNSQFGNVKKEDWDSQPGSGQKDSHNHDNLFPVGPPAQKTDALGEDAPYTRSPVFEDYTFNMIIEPGEPTGDRTGTGLIIPEFKTASGLDDARIGTMSGRPFYELPAGGTWVTQFVSGASSYWRTMFYGPNHNDNRMGNNRWFFPIASASTAHLQSYGASQVLSYRSSTSDSPGWDDPDQYKYVCQNDVSLVNFGLSKSDSGLEPWTKPSKMVVNESRYMNSIGGSISWIQSTWPNVLVDLPLNPTTSAINTHKENLLIAPTFSFSTWLDYQDEQVLGSISNRGMSIFGINANRDSQHPIDGDDLYSNPDIRYYAQNPPLPRDGLYFDGLTDVVTIPNSIGFFDTYRHVTMCWWMKLHSMDNMPAGQRTGIIGSRYAGNDNFNFHIHDNGEFHLWLSATCNYRWNIRENAFMKNPAAWHHIGFTFDGQTVLSDIDRVKLFIDGLEVTGKTMSGTTPTHFVTTQLWRIGQTAYSGADNGGAHMVMQNFVALGDATNVWGTINAADWPMFLEVGRHASFNTFNDELPGTNYYTNKVRLHLPMGAKEDMTHEWDRQFHHTSHNYLAHPYENKYICTKVSASTFAPIADTCYRGKFNGYSVTEDMSMPFMEGGPKWYRAPYFNFYLESSRHSTHGINEMHYTTEYVDSSYRVRKIHWTTQRNEDPAIVGAGASEVSHQNSGAADHIVYVVADATYTNDTFGGLTTSRPRKQEHWLYINGKKYVKQGPPLAAFENDDQHTNPLEFDEADDAGGYLTRNAYNTPWPYKKSETIDDLPDKYKVGPLFVRLSLGHFPLFHHWGYRGGCPDNADNAILGEIHQHELGPTAFWRKPLADADVALIYNDHYPTDLRLASTYNTSGMEDHLSVYYLWPFERFRTDANKSAFTQWSQDYATAYPVARLHDKLGLAVWDQELNMDVFSDFSGHQRTLTGVNYSKCYTKSRRSIGNPTVARIHSVEGWSTPNTRNNMYFWGENLLGGFENTPNTVALKLMSVPTCFTSYSQINSSYDDMPYTSAMIGDRLTQTIYQLNWGQVWDYNSHSQFPDGPITSSLGAYTHLYDNGVSNTSSVVFYKGLNGIIESKVNISGLGQTGGGFVGANHWNLQGPIFHTEIKEGCFADTNYHAGYRAWSWPVIYDTNDNIWEASGNYTHPYSSLLSDTQLEIESGDTGYANRPWTKNVSVTISRKGEGIIDPKSTDISSPVSPVDLADRAKSKTMDFHDIGITQAYHSPMQTVDQDTVFKDTIKSVSFWFSAEGIGNNLAGTLFAKCENKGTHSLGLREGAANRGQARHDHYLYFDGLSTFLETATGDEIYESGEQVETTYSFWARHDVSSEYQAIFSHGNNPTFYITYGGQPMYWVVGGNRYVYFEKIPELTDNKWHHWLVYNPGGAVIDPHAIRVFCDGKELTKETVATSASTANYAGNLTWGCNAGVNNWFKGGLNHLMIFEGNHIDKLHLLYGGGEISSHYDHHIAGPSASTGDLAPKHWWTPNDKIPVSSYSGTNTRPDMSTGYYGKILDFGSEDNPLTTRRVSALSQGNIEGADLNAMFARLPRLQLNNSLSGGTAAIRNTWDASDTGFYVDPLVPGTHYVSQGWKVALCCQKGDTARISYTQAYGKPGAGVTAIDSHEGANAVWLSKTKINVGTYGTTTPTILHEGRINFRQEHHIQVNNAIKPSTDTNAIHFLHRDAGQNLSDNRVYVDCGASSPIDNLFQNGGASVSCWFYIDEGIPGVYPSYRILMEKGNVTSIGWSIRLFKPAKLYGWGLQFKSWFSGGLYTIDFKDPNYAYKGYSGNSTTDRIPNQDYWIQPNRWHHFVLTANTLSGDYAQGYLDGVRLARTADAVGAYLTDVGVDFNIGSQASLGGSSGAFGGYMRDVALFVNTLDEDTIQEFFAKGTTLDLAAHPNASNLKGYWRLNEGVGTTPQDSSGSGLHGVFAGTDQTWETLRQTTNPEIYLDTGRLVMKQVVFENLTSSYIPDETLEQARNDSFTIGGDNYDNDAMVAYDVKFKRNFYGFNGEWEQCSVFSESKTQAHVTDFYSQAPIPEDMSDKADLIDSWAIDMDSITRLDQFLPYERLQANFSNVNGNILTSAGGDPSAGPNLITLVKGPTKSKRVNVYDASAYISDPAGWDGLGFKDYTMFTQNSAIPAKGQNTVGVANGVSFKSWQKTLTSSSTTNSHSQILVPSMFGFVYPNGVANSGYTGTTQFWKTAFIYDGMQEGELSEQHVPDWFGSVKENRLVKFFFNPATLSKRVSHVLFFRALSDAVGAITPDSFYRLVKSIRLDDNIALETDPIFGTTRVVEFEDTGVLTSTYDAITGISESVINTMPFYNLSAQASGSLFVADCYHNEGGGKLSEFIFKSKPYKFDQFDWTLDYLTISDIPTALASYNGKIYAFTADNTIRINATSMFVEDEFIGAGCLNDESYVITEFGLYYFDKNNIYRNEGTVPEPIGHPILKSNDGTIGFQELMATHDVDVFKPKMLFDNEKNCVVTFLPGNKAWSYSILRQRWDMWEYEEAMEYFNYNGEISYINDLPRGQIAASNISLDYGSFTALLGGVPSSIELPTLNSYMKDLENNRGFTWESKSINVGLGSQKKYFYQIDTIYKGHKPTLHYGTNGSTPVHLGIETELDDNHSKMKIQRQHKKERSIKLKLDTKATRSGNSGVATIGEPVFSFMQEINGGAVPPAQSYTLNTLDFDKNQGTGCKIQFNLAAWSSAGNLTINVPASGVQDFTFQNDITGRFRPGEMFTLFITSGSIGTEFEGQYTIVELIDSNKIKVTHSGNTNFASSAGTNYLIHHIESFSVTDPGSGYDNSPYLPDSFTASNPRLLIDPKGMSDMTAGATVKSLRILFPILTLGPTNIEKTQVDTLGLIYRPSSKVRM